MNEKNENNIKNDFLRKINILDGKEYDMIQIMKKIDNKVQFYSLVDAIKKKTYEIETIYSDKNECFYKDSKVFSLYYSYCVNQYGKFIDTMSDYTMQMKKKFY